MPRTATLVLLISALALVTACPTQVSAPNSDSAKASGTPVTDASDPRVVQDGDDLYQPESAPHPAKTGPAPGSGRPDTTNGVCKLFAPKLPTPECCPAETGFDAEAVKQICGHELYMGESLQGSCGYFFLPDVQGSPTAMMRGSILKDTDVTEAAGKHDRQLARVTQNPDFASAPVPGVEGAMWSQAENIHWAFIPGWDRVRLISWQEDACPTEKMPEVLALIIAAKPPPPNAPREMIPKARH